MQRYQSRRGRPVVDRSAELTALALSVSALLLPMGTTAPAARPSLPVEVVVGPQALGTVPKGLFGANLLWADDAEGSFDPTAGKFYPGFVSLMRRLRVSALRYPGGITSDSFQWRRAIGPMTGRLPNEPYGVQGASPSCCVLDDPQPSVVGPDEFGRLLDELGDQGTVTVNFATGTAQQAADFVAYMTAPVPKVPTRNRASAGYWAGLRARYGHPAPYDVPIWEVGNEQFAPTQFGWRSGRLVSYGGGRHRGCPPTASDIASCLYVFGGTTRFSHQLVGTFADELPSASYSDGKPGQHFYVWYPPVVPGTATVYVRGRPWREVSSLALAGPGAEDYALGTATGEVSFGGGAHGAVPPKGAQVTVSYDSGPHMGFIDFYKAMKAMSPHIKVCESEGPSTTFMALMGERYPYDCVILHEYLVSPSPLLPLDSYEADITAGPLSEGYSINAIEEAATYYTGHGVPVYVTEYGQPVVPRPAADLSWNLSLGEGLSTAEQLVEFAYHHVSLAEKYLAVSEPFGSLAGTGPPGSMLSKVELLHLLAVLDGLTVKSGLSPDNALIAHAGPFFVPEPDGLAVGLLSKLAGSDLSPVTVLGASLIGQGQAPELWALASRRRAVTYLFVVNANPTRQVDIVARFPARSKGYQLVAYTLDGPSLASYNTLAQPNVVAVAKVLRAVRGPLFSWHLAPHSATLFELGQQQRLAHPIGKRPQCRHQMPLNDPPKKTRTTPMSFHGISRAGCAVLPRGLPWRRACKAHGGDPTSALARSRPSPRPHYLTSLPRDQATSCPSERSRSIEWSTTGIGYPEGGPPGARHGSNSQRSSRPRSSGTQRRT
jgi:alpha-N-arabinofuranosidase